MQVSDLKAAGDFAQNFGYSGIYKIFNTISEKFYIGSALNFKRRWQEHKKELRGNRHRNSRLQASWNLHGEEAFEFEIIELVENKIDLIKREQFWLDTTKCYNDWIGYNINKIAQSCLGIKRSAETREKQRLAKLGKKQKPEHIAARAEKIKGHKVTEAQREATRQRSLGNTWGLGFKQSPEARAKISAGNKGKPKSEAHRQKIKENARKKFPFPSTTPIEY